MAGEVVKLNTTFYANHGSYNDGSDSFILNTKTNGSHAISEFMENPTRNGCTFLGWSTTYNGEIEYYPDSLVAADLADHTGVLIPSLYAVWDKGKKYLVSESELAYLAKTIRYISGTSMKLSFPDDFIAILYAKYPTHIYGYSRDLNDSNPDTCITYIGENASFSAAKMGSSTFDYGSWENAWFMPKPCMLKFDGTVESYLNPNDYTKTTTGDASNVASSTTANAMMQWPIIWVYREYSSDDNTYKFHVSNKKVNDNYKCLANINANGDIVPFYTAIYDGIVGTSNRLRSLSGRTPTANNTAENEVTYAIANGSGWYTDVLVDRLLINDLLVLIGKSTNTQATFGMGYSSISAVQNSGFGNTKGLFWGNTSSGSYGVKVFGMENWWGNVWRRTAGYINDCGTQKIKLTYGTQDGSTTTGYNSTGDGYITLVDSTPTDGFISYWLKTEYGLIPIGGSGSYTTYDCDYLATDNGKTNYALFGGYINCGNEGGAFFVDLSCPSSATDSHRVAALSYK